MKTYAITYDIVTPDSAEYGDTAERGYWMPGGWRYAQHDDGTYPDADLSEYDIKADSIRELAQDAIRDGYHCGGQECPRWLTWGGESDYTATTECGDPGTETRHLHPGNLSDEEWFLVCRWVAAGRVPDDDDDGAPARHVVVWTYHDDRWQGVRLELDGDAVHLVSGGRTEEGWTRSAEVLRYVSPGLVVAELYSDGADCDGRASSESLWWCAPCDLEHHPADQYGPARPLWVRQHSRRRDYAAERAGY
jgi:hypothetical protein